MDTQLLVRLFDRLSPAARDRVTEALLEELAGGGNGTRGRSSRLGGDGSLDRRGPGKAKAGRATEEQVLAYVARNPDQRTETISKAIGADAKPALARLRASKLVRTKGERRATTYQTAEKRAGKGKAKA